MGKNIIKTNQKTVVKINLGIMTEPGFLDIDGKKLPFKLKSNSVTLLSCRNLVEKINPLNDGFIKFMNECWRVLKEGGQFRILTPYAGSMGYWADPTNVNGCTPHTFQYFDPNNKAGLYTLYKPKPWKVEQSFFQSDGVMEVLLSKILSNEKK